MSVDDNRTGGTGYNDSSEDTENIKKLAEQMNISFEHARIIYFSSAWMDHKEFKWTTWDAAWWLSFGGSDFINAKKKAFISNYKDVIIDAAFRYDIPAFLLAGVAYIEFGGDLMWGDDVMYTLRTFEHDLKNYFDNYSPSSKDPNKTSFGNTSIQVRRALEMLNYTGTSKQKDMVIQLLKNPIQSIFMTARHLDVLRDVDFSHKSASELADEEIQIIASRYHLGPEAALEEAKNWGYGKDMFQVKDIILDALK